jgi:hypothetical protein
LKAYTRKFGGQLVDGSILVDVLPISTTSTAGANSEKTEERADETSSTPAVRKNRKAVLRILESLPDGHAFLWPVWGSDGDVDSSWSVEDWRDIR